MDNLTGTNRNDILNGGAGNDVITGGAGADNMDGGANADVFIIAAAADHAAGETITGGTETDVIRFTSTAAGTLVLTANVNVEEARITNAAGSSAGTTNENINAASAVGTIALHGNNGNNQLTGNGLANLIYGNAGDDTITGGADADKIDVGTGTDLVVLRNNDTAANNATGSSVSTIGMDIYTGLGVGDQLEIYRSITWNSFASVERIGLVRGVDDTIVFTTGTYDAANNTFTADGAGSDSLVTYDVLIDYAGGTDFESIVLVGFAGWSNTGTSSSGHGALVTLSI